MKYCSDCGCVIEFITPENEDRPRHVCSECKTIHYTNPKIVAGCIPEWGDRVLLCRRAIEPQYGKWTLPAGYMENGETTTQTALRETLEEANANVRILDLYMVINLPHVDQVYMMYRSELEHEAAYSAGAESLEVDLYHEHQVPWDELAFPVMKETLRFYYQDKKQGNFKIRTGEIIRNDEAYLFNLHT